MRRLYKEFVAPGAVTENGLDKHSNKDKDWLCSANDPRGIGGLLPGNKFL